jgi:rhamnose transport system substrate-binding protein
MKISRPFTIVAVTAALALSLTACVKSGSTSANAGATGSAGASSTCATGPVKVGYIPKLGTDPYMTTVRDGAQEAAKELGGEVIYTEPSEATGAAQIPFVNQLISQGVGVIAISGSDANGAAAALKAAQAKGIKVITFDSDVAPDARSLFINQADSRCSTRWPA